MRDGEQDESTGGPRGSKEEERVRERGRERG